MKLRKARRLRAAQRIIEWLDRRLALPPDSVWTVDRDGRVRTDERPVILRGNR